MPMYDYSCDCGTTFEVLVPSWSSPAPDCPDCGARTHRRPPSPAVHGRAAPPTPLSSTPKSWEGLNNGDPATITHWRRTAEARREFEARHPEHHTRQEAIAAHEGRFERAPLTYRELATRAATTGDANRAAAEASRARGGDSSGE
ncbi:zinc ribbon domain-containing protein [Saccharopolyspora rhizosphaerae]|uniref:Zinc ribbon domain-containing protein n=1 Tax=Saccharopolyspora rhizosphaerae TaxID=2492662 RepID=A0A3R8P1B9_9PSEU|nr:zinc ribbon domain-containing protein [Saccharopolyspora rhizosphaerae]RRO14296.1 zinc ribbon domain-containing protein [Saccharopolyspora rhizosphaerae]